MSATQKTPVLFLGATGYIGGSIFARLLKHSSAPSLEITAMVRSEEKAKKLEALGVKTAIGTIQDLELLEKLASQAHIVFSLINCDDDPHMEAILRDLKKRHEATGDLPILIHASGTGVFVTYDKGLVGPSGEPWDDLDIARMETLPHSALHRSVEELVIAADKDGYATTYIVSPSTVVGVATGPLVEAGIQHAHSQQIPLVVKASIARGQGGMVGKGAGTWNFVGLDDAADLFLILYDAVIKPGNTVAHGREGYYIGENGRFTWLEVGDEIAKVLYEKGIGKTPEATTFSPEELVKYFGSEDIGNLLAGANTISVGNRSRALGWRPKYTKADLIASIRDEVNAALKA